MAKPNQNARRSPWQLILVLLLIAGCTSQCTAPCGTVTFNDEGVIDTTSSNGWDMSLDFDFTPADCGVSCTCNKVVYVQVMRVVDHENGTYLYLNSEKEDRATAEGWHVDRLQGRIWGYYGRNDNGSFASSITVGSETTTASLEDTPSRGESEPYIGFTWMAVTVPVCIDNATSSCNEQLLGFHEWGWIVGDTGGVATFDWAAPKGFKDGVDDAIAEWNADAAGLGYNNFPAFTRLSE